MRDGMMMTLAKEMGPKHNLSAFLRVKTKSSLFHTIPRLV